MESESQDSDPIEAPICLHCAAELTGHEHFCAKCGCPVTPMAASLPYESILARGFAAREASSRPRKLIVVLGMWIMCGPMFVIFATGFFVMLFRFQGIAWQHDRFQDIPGNLFGMAVSGTLAAILGTLIYKTTKNYLKFRRETSEEAEEDDDNGGDTVIGN